MSLAMPSPTRAGRGVLYLALALCALVALFPVLELSYDATQTDASLTAILASEMQTMKKAS